MVQLCLHTLDWEFDTLNILVGIDEAFSPKVSSSKSGGDTFNTPLCVVVDKCPRS